MNFPLKRLYFLAIGLCVLGSLSIQAQNVLLQDSFHQTEISQPGNLPPVFSQNNLKTVDKTEVDIQDLTNGVWLNYRIRFQNNTSGVIANIRIKDSLSTHLDFSTFQFTGSSHSGQFLLYTSGNLYIYYTAINLPDSATNYATSQGSFRFKIKLKESLPLGTTIYNSADIMFDFNSAILTNTVQTDIVNYTSASIQNEYNSILLFPNPAFDVLSIEWTNDKMNEIQILDFAGKVVMSDKVLPGSNYQNVNLSNLNAGMYFVHLISDEGLNSYKFIKH